MRAAIYCRVSTKDQSLDLQTKLLIEYCVGRGWSHQVFAEKISGTKSKRPELLKIMELARTGQIDVVVCLKLDRFARSLKDLLSLLYGLTSHNVAFVCVKDQIDLTTPAGKLMVHLLGAFAEFEASLIKERVTSGVRAAIEKRGRWGKAPKVTISQVLALRSKNMTASEIGQKLGISRSSVFNAMKRAVS